MFQKLSDRISSDLAKYDELQAALPKRHRYMSLDGVAAGFQSIIVDVINSLWSQNPMGLFCLGDVGVGKTAILIIIQTYIRLEYGGLYQAADHHQFLTHFELVRTLREYQEARSQSKDGLAHRPNCFHVRFLFVDDLGRGYDDKSGWNLALLDEFFDERWANQKTMFVTTNKTIDELRTWEGWSRIVDRLTDPSWMRVINMGEGSRRK